MGGDAALHSAKAQHDIGARKHSMISERDHRRKVEAVLAILSMNDVQQYCS
jgi:hypothetical protein